ncbi:MAG: HYR domain-containing protein [Acidobacteria bacterium]|nr:HYR domain-containing protein [Acidobacteriota bacterium]
MRQERMLFVAVMMLVAGMAVPVRAADGDLDPSFSFDGKVTTDFSGFGDAVTAVVIDAHGRIVAAGVSSDGVQRDFAVARYNEDGTLDTSFGTNGLVTVQFDGKNASANAVAVDGQGRIVVAGVSYIGTHQDIAVARLNDDGTLDTVFNGTGTVTTAFGISSFASGVAIDAGGKIIVAGGSANIPAARMALVRYNEDGTLDDTFDGDSQGDGKVTFDFAGISAFGFAVALDSGGRIVVAGTSNGLIAVARCHADGTLDHDFNGTGRVTTDVGGHGDTAHAIALDADGRIVVGGRSAFVSGVSGSHFTLVRYNGDGSLDTGFNTTGTVVTDVSPQSEILAVAVDAAGKIVAAGIAADALNSQTHPMIAVARYLHDGTLDGSFGGGIVITDFDDALSLAQAVAIDAHAGIVVAGSSTVDFGLIRLLSSSVPPCALVCPGSFTMPTDPGQCGAAVTYPAPTESGACGTVTCDHLSGSLFPVGDTDVSCSDGAASCTFKVTVHDVEPPRITCPASVVAPGTSSAGVPVTYPSPAATDNCPGATTSCAPPSGSIFPVGTTPVACAATDASGNADSCGFGVTVERADLAISESTTVTKVSPGQSLVYTLQLVNNGPGPAGDVVINDAVPANCTFVSATGAGLLPPPVGAGGTVSWWVGPLASGSTVKVTVTVKVSSKGKNSVSNTAGVISPTFDPNPANNNATLTTRIPSQGK